MPNARPSRRPRVVCALSVAFALLLAAALAFPREAARASSAAAAAACPSEPPPPTRLRMLYRESERVVAARVDESVVPEGQQNTRRTTFVVTESIEGDPGEKSFFVYHPVWSPDPNYVGNFHEGETLLLFLNRAEGVEPGGYHVTDVRSGAKRLSEADLKIYLKRIEELQWITRQEPLDRAELLEWLVRCVEEPATRWEGAYELALSSQFAAYEAEEAQEKASAAPPQISDSQLAAENPAEEDGASSGVSISSGPLIDSKLIGQLTAAQKERLAGALYGAEKWGGGELQLVLVVDNWDGARLASFILSRLQKLRDDPPYDAEQLIYALARVLKDDRLNRLAETYAEKAPYDDGLVEDEAGEADESAAASEEEASEGEAEGVEGEGEDSEQQDDSGEAEEIMAGVLVKQADGARPTAAQVRGRMLHNFLAAVEKRMNAAGAETAQR